MRAKGRGFTRRRVRAPADPQVDAPGPGEAAGPGRALGQFLGRLYFLILS
jgi:hypothetical protein